MWEASDPVELCHGYAKKELLLLITAVEQCTQKSQYGLLANNICKSHFSPSFLYLKMMTITKFDLKDF